LRLRSRAAADAGLLHFERDDRIDAGLRRSVREATTMMRVETVLTDAALVLTTAATPVPFSGPGIRQRQVRYKLDTPHCKLQKRPLSSFLEFEV
jgi:hypothetical protein